MIDWEMHRDDDGCIDIFEVFETVEPISLPNRNKAVAFLNDISHLNDIKSSQIAAVIIALALLFGKE